MGNLTSSYASAVTGSVNASAFVSISAPLSAGANVDAWSGGNMTIPSVTAGGSASLTALGGTTNLTSVTAGQSASITAFGALAALDVHAGGDANLFAVGPMQADVTATNAWLFGANDVEAIVVTSADAGISSLGSSLKMNVTAGGDAGAYSGGSITASILDRPGRPR